VRTVLFGAATGSRSQLPVAVLATVLARRAPEPATSAGALGARLLSQRSGRTVFGIAAATELVIDKLPATPSRLQRRGLAFRVLLGAIGGAVLAAVSGRSQSANAGVGALAAVGASFIGARYRLFAVARTGTDWPGAVSEDVVAFGLAAASVRGL
jgi:uncharacterized membrane protein